MRILELGGKLKLIAQSCPTLCNPTGCSLPGSSVCGILQARILEWVAISFSRGSSGPRIEPGSPALQADSLPTEGSWADLGSNPALLHSNPDQRPPPPSELFPHLENRDETQKIEDSEDERVQSCNFMTVHCSV